MRSAAIAAAFAAGALAVPYNKRDEVATAYDITYVTDVVTVTAGAYGAKSTSSSHSSSASVAPKKNNHFGHHNFSASSSAAPTSTYVPETTYVAPSPTSTPESTWEAPSPTAAASTKAASGTGSAPAPAGTSYQDVIIYHHNLHRANHSSPALEWDQDLADTAQVLADKCIFQHDVTLPVAGKQVTYGQNIAEGITADQVGRVITDMFYNAEFDAYGLANFGGAPDMSTFDDWGHLSQLLWKDSTKVGCATNNCDGSNANTVCNYLNAGNWDGEYANNVLSPLGEATAAWNAGLDALKNAVEGFFN